MTTIHTKWFGSAEYTPDCDTDFELADITLNGISSRCEVSLYEGLNEQELLASMALLDNLESLDQRAKEQMLTLNKRSDATVRPFVDGHFQEYGDDVRQQVLDKLNMTEQDNEAFIKNMALGGVFAFKESGGAYITLDYNLIWDGRISFTDQILAVRFNLDGELLSISHDS